LNYIASFDPISEQCILSRKVIPLPDIHASPFPLQAGDLGKKTRGIFGRISHALLTKSNHKSVSLKTSRDISLWEPPKSSATFAKWALKLKQDCFQRSERVRPTFGEGSSLWPTPTTAIYWCRTEVEVGPNGIKYRTDPSQKGNQFGIGRVARTWTMIYLLAKATGAKQMGKFNYQYLHPLHLILRAGPRYSPGDLTFNPNFSDWVMGWPIGWSNPEQRVTGFVQWQQHMLGNLSKLPFTTFEGVYNGF